MIYDDVEISIILPLVTITNSTFRWGCQLKLVLFLPLVTIQIDYNKLTALLKLVLFLPLVTILMVREILR